MPKQETSLPPSDGHEKPIPFSAVPLSDARLQSTKHDYLVERTKADRSVIAEVQHEESKRRTQEANSTLPVTGDWMAVNVCEADEAAADLIAHKLKTQLNEVILQESELQLKKKPKSRNKCHIFDCTHKAVATTTVPSQRPLLTELKQIDLNQMGKPKDEEGRKRAAERIRTNKEFLILEQTAKQQEREKRLDSILTLKHSLDDQRRFTSYSSQPQMRTEPCDHPTSIPTGALTTGANPSTNPTSTRQERTRNEELRFRHSSKEREIISKSQMRSDAIIKSIQEDEKLFLKNFREQNKLKKEHDTWLRDKDPPNVVSKRTEFLRQHTNTDLLIDPLQQGFLPSQIIQDKDDTFNTISKLHRDLHARDEIHLKDSDDSDIEGDAAGHTENPPAQSATVDQPAIPPLAQSLALSASPTESPLNRPLACPPRKRLPVLKNPPIRHPLPPQRTVGHVLEGATFSIDQATIEFQDFEFPGPEITEAIIKMRLYEKKKKDGGLDLWIQSQNSILNNLKEQLAQAKAAPKPKASKQPTGSQAPDEPKLPQSPSDIEEEILLKGKVAKAYWESLSIKQSLMIKNISPTLSSMRINPVDTKFRGIFDWETSSSGKIAAGKFVECLLTFRPPLQPPNLIRPNLIQQPPSPQPSASATSVTSTGSKSTKADPKAKGKAAVEAPKPIENPLVALFSADSILDAYEAMNFPFESVKSNTKPDIVSQFVLATETGNLAIPINCFKARSDIKVLKGKTSGASECGSAEEGVIVVDMGGVTVGESVKCDLKIENTGALDEPFELIPCELNDGMNGFMSVKVGGKKAKVDNKTHKVEGCSSRVTCDYDEVCRVRGTNTLLPLTDTFKGKTGTRLIFHFFAPFDLLMGGDRKFLERFFILKFSGVERRIRVSVELKCLPLCVSSGIYRSNHFSAMTQDAYTGESVEALPALETGLQPPPAAAVALTTVNRVPDKYHDIGVIVYNRIFRQIIKIQNSSDKPIDVQPFIFTEGGTWSRHILGISVFPELLNIDSHSEGIVHVKIRMTEEDGMKWMDRNEGGKATMSSVTSASVNTIEDSADSVFGSVGGDNRWRIPLVLKSSAMKIHLNASIIGSITNSKINFEPQLVDFGTVTSGKLGGVVLDPVADGPVLTRGGNARMVSLTNESSLEQEIMITKIPKGVTAYWDDGETVEEFKRQYDRDAYAKEDEPQVGSSESVAEPNGGRQEVTHPVDIRKYMLPVLPRSFNSCTLLPGETIKLRFTYAPEFPSSLDDQIEFRSIIGKLGTACDIFNLKVKGVSVKNLVKVSATQVVLPPVSLGSTATGNIEFTARKTTSRSQQSHTVPEDDEVITAEVIKVKSVDRFGPNERENGFGLRLPSAEETLVKIGVPNFDDMRLRVTPSFFRLDAGGVKRVQIEYSPIEKPKPPVELPKLEVPVDQPKAGPKTKAKAKPDKVEPPPVEVKIRRPAPPGETDFICSKLCEVIASEDGELDRGLRSPGSRVFRLPVQVKRGADIQQFWISVEASLIAPVLIRSMKELDFGTVCVGDRKVIAFELSQAADFAQGEEVLVRVAKGFAFQSGLSIVGSLKAIKKGKPCSVKVAFEPTCDRLMSTSFRLVVVLKGIEAETETEVGYVDIPVKAFGVLPKLTFDPPEGVIDFGVSLEKVSRVFTIRNNSECNVPYSFKYKSASPDRKVMKGSCLVDHPHFTFYPSSGVLPPLGTVDIEASFNPPEKQSTYNFEGLFKCSIGVYGGVLDCLSVQFMARSFPRQVFCLSGDNFVISETGIQIAGGQKVTFKLGAQKMAQKDAIDSISYEISWKNGSVPLKVDPSLKGSLTAGSDVDLSFSAVEPRTLQASKGEYTGSLTLKGGSVPVGEPGDMEIKLKVAII